MSDFLRGFSFTPQERRELIGEFADAANLSYESARRQFDRYVTLYGSERAVPSGERAELLKGVVTEYYDKQPSRGANTEDLGYNTKPIDRFDLRYRDRADAEQVANAIRNNRYDAFHNDRITAVYVKYLPPGSTVDVYNPTTRSYQKERVGRYGEWIVQTEGYSAKDVPVETG